MQVVADAVDEEVPDRVTGLASTGRPRSLCTVADGLLFVLCRSGGNVMGGANSTKQQSSGSTRAMTSGSWLVTEGGCW